MRTTGGASPTTIAARPTALIEYEFPFPVATAFRNAEEADHEPATRLNRLLQAAEALAQFIGTVAYADACAALRLGKSKRDLEAAVRSCNLRLGSQGLWGHCIANVLPLVPAPFVSEFVDLRADPQRWGALIGALTILTDQRNATSHPKREITDAEARRRLPAVSDAFFSLCETVGFLADYRLVAVDECAQLNDDQWNARLLPLHGYNAQQRAITVDTAHDLNRGDVLLIRLDGDGSALLLSPLYVASGGCDMKERLYAYSKLEENVPVYFRAAAPEGNTSLESQVRQRPDEMPRGRTLRLPLNLAGTSLRPLRVARSSMDGEVSDDHHGAAIGAAPSPPKSARRFRQRAMLIAPLATCLAGAALWAWSGTSQTDANEDHTSTPSNSAASIAAAPVSPTVNKGTTPKAVIEKVPAPVQDEAHGSPSEKAVDSPPAPEDDVGAVPAVGEENYDEDAAQQAVAAYATYINAFNARDAVAYFSTYADPVVCFYSKSNMPQMTVRERRWAMFVEAKGTYHAEAIEAVGASADQVVFRERGHLEHEGKAFAQHHKGIVMKLRDGRWRIAVEVDDQHHACIDGIF